MTYIQIQSTFLPFNEEVTFNIKKNLLKTNKYLIFVENAYKTHTIR